MQQRDILTRWILVFVLCFGSSPRAALALQHLGLSLSDCTLGTEKYSARCGTFTVYEDRVSSSGRTIALALIVLPATRPTHKAIFWNPGGPGASAVASAPFIAAGVFAKELTDLRDQYDIVLVDNRGVGGSGSQQCETSPPEHPEYYFLQLWPDVLLKACRDRLAKSANLSLYTSNLAVDDLEDIRAALGYQKVVLNGGSYGTFLYLVYMRRHPEHVESAVLDGVAPPGLLIVPLEDAAGAQQAMNQLFIACAKDAECARQFPHLPEHFENLVKRFDAGPISVPVKNHITNVTQSVLLSKEVFADRLRQTLYSPAAAAYVPYAIERSYVLDYAPLAEMIDTTTRRFASVVDVGANLSTTCAEDIPFITEREVRRTSADSFEGDLRVRAQQRACRIWKVEPVTAAFNNPVRTNIPILMVSGSDDPASPPKYAELALPFLPNARRILVKEASHVTELPCTDKLKVEFVLAGSARGLDLSSCSGSFVRPSFATSMNGF